MPSYGDSINCPVCNTIFKPAIYRNKKQECCSIKCKTKYRIIKFYNENPIQWISNETLKIPLLRGSFTTISVEDRDLAYNHIWSLNKQGYVERYSRKSSKDRQEHHLLHREILSVTDPKVQVDHKDLNRVNNQRNNLRKGTRALNAQNVPPQPHSSSKYRGVGWDKYLQKWRSNGTLNNKRYYLGKHNNELYAAKIAESFRRKHMPFAMPDYSLDPLPNCRCKICQ